jgi:hypothetical protein
VKVYQYIYILVYRYTCILVKVEGERVERAV